MHAIVQALLDHLRLTPHPRLSREGRQNTCRITQSNGRSIDAETGVSTARSENPFREIEPYVRRTSATSGHKMPSDAAAISPIDVLVSALVRRRHGTAADRRLPLSYNNEYVLVRGDVWNQN